MKLFLRPIYLQTRTKDSGKPDVTDLNVPITLITFKVVLVTIGMNFSFLLLDNLLFVCLHHKQKYC